MTTVGRTILLLLTMTLAAGCAPWTPEQTADYQERERQLSEECARRNGMFVERVLRLPERRRLEPKACSRAAPLVAPRRARSALSALW